MGGYTPDNPLDALIVGYYEGDKLILRVTCATASSLACGVECGRS